MLWSGLRSRAAEKRGHDLRAGISAHWPGRIRLTCQFEAWSLESPHNNTTSRTTPSTYVEKRQRSTLDSKRSDGVPKVVCLGVTTTTRSRLTGPPLNREAFQRHFWKPRWNSQAGIAGDQSDRESRNPAAPMPPPTALWASDERLSSEGELPQLASVAWRRLAPVVSPRKRLRCVRGLGWSARPQGWFPPVHQLGSLVGSAGAESRHCDTDLILICAVGACLVEL